MTHSEHVNSYFNLPSIPFFAFFNRQAYKEKLHLKSLKNSRPKDTDTDTEHRQPGNQPEALYHHTGGQARRQANDDHFINDMLSKIIVCSA